MSVPMFNQWFALLVVVGLMASFGLRAPKWANQVIIVASGFVLSLYAGAVLVVNMPHGIATGFWPSVTCFVGGALWSALWFVHFAESYKDSRAH